MKLKITKEDGSSKWNITKGSRARSDKYIEQAHRPRGAIYEGANGYDLTGSKHMLEIYGD
jgi:hypothetical protein